MSGSQRDLGVVDESANALKIAFPALLARCAPVAFYVYILASGRNGTLYIGSTDSLGRRVGEHREELTPGFTSRYGVKMLVWYETFDSRDDAFRRERQMKVWRWAWKIELIAKTNLGWRDLYAEIC